MPERAAGSRIPSDPEGLAAFLKSAQGAGAPHTRGLEVRPKAVRDFLAEAPKYLAAARAICEEVATSDRSMRAQLMEDVYRRVERFATTAGLAELKVAAHLGRTLGTLVKKLCGNPNTITASTLNTVSKALAFLAQLCAPGVEEKLAGNAPFRMLVVDDDPLAKRAVMSTLQLAFEKPESANDGAAALALVAQKPYDVIFTDVQMPFMDGFELCALIRESGPNSSTPVVFISSNTDPDSLAQGYRSGASDYIGKPFLPVEMTVKALTFAWAGRLQQIEAGASSESGASPT